MIAHVMTYAAYRRTVHRQRTCLGRADDVDDDPLSWFVA